MERVIAIDLGTKRIGVAVTDGLGLTAQPLTMIPRHGGVRDLDAIAKVVTEYEARTVVLGLPLDPEGRETSGSKGARAFAVRLAAALGPAVRIDLVDESFSTVEAEAFLVGADVSRARRKQVVDKLAAAVILKRWLDRRETVDAGANLGNADVGVDVDDNKEKPNR